MSTTSNQLTPGMTIAIGKNLYKVESSLKVTLPKGTPFIKAKLKDLNTHETLEKSFKLNQPVNNVTLIERKLEFLYPEENDFLFLDIVELDQVSIPRTIVGDKINFLKEGVELKGLFYGESAFAVELPQFLELMVVKIESDIKKKKSSEERLGVLETGAKVKIPPFVEVGDIIKVDTKQEEYIQRV